MRRSQYLSIVSHILSWSTRSDPKLQDRFELRDTSKECSVGLKRGSNDRVAYGVTLWSCPFREGSEVEAEHAADD
jgi:hypothetical protein